MKFKTSPLLILKPEGVGVFLKIVCFVLLVCMGSQSARSQQLDVLVIGSTHSYSDGGESGVVHEKPFNPTTIATRLRSILSQDSAISGTTNVEFEDVFKTKALSVPIGGGGTAWPMTFHCYSLMQHFMWPENKTTRMANLRGEGDHQWDYIVLCEDPYVMANFPGVYAEGVKMIQNEISKSANPAQLILLGQWPENSSTYTATEFNKIVHRVGNSGEIKVAPAAKAWASYGSQDTSSSHPTPRGQYLAAAAIYSKMFNRSAKASGYTYSSDGDNIADHVLSEVQSAASIAQYTGKYTKANAFQMGYFRGRTVDWNEYGTSTEEGFANGLKAAFTAAKVSNVRRDPPASGDPVDLSYSRGTDAFEANKQYRVNAAQFNRVHGFPVGDHRGQADTEEGQETMRYGIDKRFYGGSSFYNGTDLGIAYSMVREGEIPQNVRGIPVRLLWSKINHFQPTINSHRDGWHLSNELDRAVGAYLYTVMSGRCPVEAEPTDTTSSAWKQWWCRKLGYETAWQMAHLTTRAPGFRITPSSASKLSIASNTSETMMVQFVNPPKSNVTVNVSLSNTNAGILGNQQLVFTPENYSTPQSVVITGLPGSSSSQNLNVTFNTSSNDKIYDGLTDSWEYTITRSSTQNLSEVDKGTTQINAYKDIPKSINLNVSGANSGNTIFAGPNHGSLSWSGSDVIYTPNPGFSGGDSFAFAVNRNGVMSRGYINIDVLNGTASGTVAYNGNGNTGGSVPFDSNTYSIGSTVTVSGNLGGLVRTRYDFTGWNTAPDGSGTSYGNGSTFTMNSTSLLLYAQWTPDPPSLNAGGDQSVLLGSQQSWGPSELSPVAWYDATDAGTIIASGGSVSQWNDKSGNAKHATQSNSSKRPTTGSRTIGGKNAIVFPNTNGQSFSIPAIDVIGKEVWAVFVVDDYSTSGSQLLLGGGGNAQIGLNSANRKLRLWSAAIPYTGDTLSNAAIAQGDTVVAGWLAHNNTKKFSINGDYQTTSDNYKGGVNLSVNAIGKGQYALMDGAIGELIVTPTLNQEDRQRMEGHLAHKWGASGKLPVSHPYKTEVPNLSAVQVTVSGSATNVEGNSVSYLWSKVSGPGPVKFANATNLTTTVQLEQEGTYVLRLMVNDGVSQVTDDVVVTVGNAVELATVTYNGNGKTGGTVPADSNTYPIGSNVTVMGNTGSLVKTGYSFSGWNSAANGSGTSYSPNSTFAINTSNVSLYAQWTPLTYAITYDGNGATVGNEPASQLKAFGVSIVLAGNTGGLTLSGSEFVGWNTSVDGSGQGFAPGATYSLNQSVIFYAQWNSIQPPNPGDTVAGLRFGSVPGNLNETTPNPGTNQDAITDMTSEIARIPGNTTEIFTGKIYDADGSISFTEHIDDKVRIWIDGNLVLSNDSWRNRSSTSNLNLSPGWHDIEIRISNGDGGSGTVGSPGIGYDPSGGTAWQPLTDSGDGSFLRVSNGSQPSYIAGLRFGEVTGNINETAVNPGTDQNIITDVASKTEDRIKGETTEIYTGQIYDADGSISFTEHIDDKVRIWIDGDIVLSNDSWRNRSNTANLNLSPGWHDIEIRISNGGGGSGPVGNPGIGYDPNGGTTWQTLSDPGDGSFLRVEIAAGSSAVVDAGVNQTVSIGAQSGWLPGDLNPQAWYDASDASTVVAAGGAVSQWNDKSGNGNHATQSNSSKRPTTASRTIGGKNVIVFPNTNGQSFSIPAIDMIGKEVWAVFVVNDYSTTSSQLLLGGSSNAQIGVNSRNQKLRLWGGNSPYTRETLSNAVIAQGETVMAGWLAHNDTKKFSVNGDYQITSDTHNSGTSFILNSIGKGQYAAMDGMIGELIITPTLNQENRQKMEGHLAHKWGTEGLLAAGHPYKGAAPGGNGVQVNLNGTVTGGGQSDTINWSVVNGPSQVSFGNPNAVDTVATFIQAGTYVLRLSVGEGASQVSDEITINVEFSADRQFSSTLASDRTAALTTSTINDLSSQPSDINAVGSSVATDTTSNETGKNGVNQANFDVIADVQLQTYTVTFERPIDFNNRGYFYRLLGAENLEGKYEELDSIKSNVTSIDSTTEQVEYVIPFVLDYKVFKIESNDPDFKAASSKDL